MILKYVMFEHVLPVLFGEYLQHDQIKVKGMQPTSAGRVSVIDGVVSVGSQSLSLNMKPASGDDKVIQRILENSL